MPVMSTIRLTQLLPSAVAVTFSPTVVGASTVVLPLRQYLAPTVTSASTVTCRVLSGPPVTLTLQPDATNGVDAVANHALPTTNNGTNTAMALGGATSTDPAYAHIKFDLSGTGAGAGPVSATLSVYTSNTVASDRDFEVWLLDASNNGWTETGLTWNTRDGTNAWTGGANGGGVVGVDIGNAAIGTGHYTASDPVDTEIPMVLSPSSLAAALGGTLYVVLKRVGTTTATTPAFRSSDSSVVASRPKLVIQYVTPAINIGTPSVAGSSTVTAAVVTPAQLAVAVVGASTVAASVGSAPLLDPAIVGTSTVSATVSSVPYLAPAVIGASTVTISVTTPPLLSATVTSSSTVTAAVSSTPYLSVTIAGGTVVDCSLGGAANLAVSVVGSTTVTASIRTRPLLVATVAGASTVTLAISTPGLVFFAPVVVGSSTVATSIATTPRIAATVVSATNVTCAIETSAQLSASIVGVSSVSVVLGVTFVPTFVVTVVSDTLVVATLGTAPAFLPIIEPTDVVLVDDGRRVAFVAGDSRRMVALVLDGRRKAEVVS